jgi:hypothetical protein
MHHERARNDVDIREPALLQILVNLLLELSACRVLAFESSGRYYPEIAAG